MSQECPCFHLHAGVRSVYKNDAREAGGGNVSVGDL